MPSDHDTAVLIACKNGAATIAATVRSARDQADVYVVSDGSTDNTAEVAAAAGAYVLQTSPSVGKPEALRAGSRHFQLGRRYRYIAVLDDDTILEEDYLAKVTARMEADPGIAAASGRIDSLWNESNRWNPFVAMRAFTYWSFQATMKRAQNALRVVNVVCGANSVFRADVFAELIKRDVPYAIDDMFWIAEIVRSELGRIAYVHKARSWTIDPLTFRDWYRQTVRWSWGQFQSIRGHRLGIPIARRRGSRFGLRFSWFDAAYLAMVLDWLPYMLEPFAFVPAAYFLSRWIDPFWFLVYYAATFTFWVGVAAIALRKPRLLLLTPALIVLDLVYRVTMVHAIVKTITRPTVDKCKWESPARFLHRRQQHSAGPIATTDAAP
jgi:poly-beta-1,6-N-acetyl-D-glucosamine synthase